MPKIKLRAEHAQKIRDETVQHLQIYLASVEGNQPTHLSVLYEAYQSLIWLADFVTSTECRYVLPTQKLFMHEAMATCLAMYEQQSQI
ncbi:hypothetical protein AO364_1215 [Moraxella catarrhalis]|nr:hypothetical protein AO364_1215 [Moraxella catarrhalis]